MRPLVYALAALVLLLLNAFFVLAEFAAVKLRSSKAEELIDQKRAGAGMVKRINDHLDEYLSLCQVGITFASIALGAVAEPLVHPLVAPFFARLGVTSPAVSHSLTVACGIAAVSYVHVLIGEQVPKLIALRATERAALLSAYPLAVFRWIFIAPLWLLNASSRAILRLIGLSPDQHAEEHSEDELRIILGRSHSGGVMSFRRLLFMENVFDFGDLRVRDAMRPRALVKSLSAGAPWRENFAIIREARLSRFPLVDGPPEKAPIGVVHIKDLVIRAPAEGDPDLRRIARPYITTHEDAPLEAVLTDMQRRRGHVAVALDKQGRWSGFLSMEDIIEEIIGTVEDEFANEAPIHLADVLSAGRVVLGVQAASLPEAIGAVLAQVPADELPLPGQQVRDALIERERLVSTYLGRGIAMPHARLPRLVKPAMIFARSDEGIPVPGREDERIHLLFILLTPAGLPRVHQRLQARIAGILESEFVEQRLREAASAGEVLEAVRTGEQTSLD